MILHQFDKVSILLTFHVENRLMELRYNLSQPTLSISCPNILFFSIIHVFEHKLSSNNGYPYKYFKLYTRRRMWPFLARSYLKEVKNFEGTVKFSRRQNFGLMITTETPMLIRGDCIRIKYDFQKKSNQLKHQVHRKWR